MSTELITRLASDSVPLHIYVVKVVQILSISPQSTLTEFYAAYADRTTAEVNAGRIAYEHMALSGVNQTSGETWPERQAYWKTTYPDGLWKEVSVHKVVFVGKMPMNLDVERM